ncbi:MAG TPA: hypothetical protein VIH37_01195, partial [Candidatus Limnocylindrales bacterium]
PLPTETCSSAVVGSAGAARGGPAWYRIDPLLDASGTLSGQRLVVGRGAARWSADLPPESFASGPVGGRVLVGDDDGNRSRLRAFDTALGCWTSLGEEGNVIRSALLTAPGVLYEHRVDRMTRRDLGVWRRAIGAGAAPATLALPGLAASAGDGPTYSTSLLAGGDGRLVVGSCGEHTCRTRVLDPASGSVAAVEGIGPALAVSGQQLVALAVCDALPCPLVAVDLRTRASRHLAASLVPGLEPVPATSTADSGIEAPPGDMALAPGGRVDDPSAVRLIDAATQLTAGEVLP